MNFECLCASCHFKAHDNPAWFVNEWTKLKGLGVLDYLTFEANHLKPITVEFYENILKEAEADLN
jgi:hypothetical protein